MNECRRTLVWALLLGPLAAFAQTAARPDPANPRLSTPAPAMESAFAGFRSYRDEPLAPWREVNEEVREVGGHAGILKEEERSATAARPSGRGTPPAPLRADAPGGEKHGH